jgi:glucose-6-phosphate-specific signal transduction histidine kinase
VEIVQKVVQVRQSTVGVVICHVIKTALVALAKDLMDIVKKDVKLVLTEENVTLVALRTAKIRHVTDKVGTVITAVKMESTVTSVKTPAEQRV